MRITTYEGLTVDERILTAGFPAMAGTGRMQVLMVLSGSVLLREPEALIEAGHAWRMPRLVSYGARFVDTRFLEIDWSASELLASRRIPRAEAELQRLADELSTLPAEGEAQRSYLRRCLETIDRGGVAIPRRLFELEGGPTERDVRLGTAVAEQFAHLKREATALHLGDDADLSPRQLQRLIEDFNARYGLNAGNWRDMRSRWRVQLAAVLLSVRALSIADVADEVGLSDGTALARVFARWKLPSPRELRERLFAEEASEDQRPSARRKATKSR